MKFCLLLIFLVTAQVFSGEVSIRHNECTMSDLLSLIAEVKSLSSTVLEYGKISCIDVNQRGAYASCSADYSVTACSCGMGCGSWDIQSQTTCHCQCNNMDWTTARCCKITTKL
ncbi:hypothetical protein GDO86_019492 [Hymenochirus boettgeri]|uniref:Resistin-like beta n=1 Tax=Hymenochirus boettgeri TaxID=247094 RepID=A0A8T2IEL6_9PIPI|nr:hypothetical protein GDO86_019492 [Hymenochirus boettgeri]KAG8431050.1 hypothetical protein GDO86_019492 [Hymenochirus boettgeri]KAG8431051.1 hypothetical protein GDO86_019492 [Hymenochirus boettgeri]